MIESQLEQDLRQAKTPEERVALLNGICYLTYDDVTAPWNTIKEKLKEFIHGKRILDIGCGLNGRLCELILELGAASYTGVDANPDAIFSSRRRHPSVEFIFDEPTHVIRQLIEEHLILSSGVFDDSIIVSDAYARVLVRSIADHTPSGAHTIHGACGFHDKFNKFFINSGFERVKMTDCINDFAVYRKK